MILLARFVVRHRRAVLGLWLLLAVAGGYAAPRAVDALSYDFSLPGQPGYETNADIVELLGSGGSNPPVVLVAGDDTARLTPQLAEQLSGAVAQVAQGGRTVSWVQDDALLSADGRTGAVLVYPRPVPGPDPYVQALPALAQVAAQVSEQAGVPVAVTGDAALQAAQGEGGGGADVLIETVFGATAALIILVLVFGSALALTPMSSRPARS